MGPGTYIPVMKMGFTRNNLKLVKVTKLPVDSTTCREWRSAFIASVSRIDTTDGDVLAKYVSHCFEGGRGKRFREALHNSVVFTRFNKHVAAELIQTDVLATNTELAAEFSSYVESCLGFCTQAKSHQGYTL